MKHGGGTFNKEASLVYSNLDSGGRTRLSSMGEIGSTVKMTPREVKKTGKKHFVKIKKIGMFFFFFFLLAHCTYFLYSLQFDEHLDFFKKMCRLPLQQIVNAV